MTSGRPTGPARAETWISSLGLALIGLHVLDDSFVHTEPGTAAGDHLVSGIVPGLVLIVAAIVAPQVRAGARAVVVLLLGAFGVVAGASDGGHDLAVGSPMGDDFTALLALCGGVVLLGVGTVLLWRSRRRDGSRKLRYLRRSLVGVAAIAVGLTVVFPALFVYGYNHVAVTCGADSRLSASQDVSFETSDRLTLAGSYVPSRNRAAVLVLPANGRCGSHRHAELLAERGYGVLMFDLRGTGGSEGDPTHWGAEKDVEAAVGFLAKRPDVDQSRIGGLGLSFGGELVLQAAAETPRLRAVVSEGAGIRSIRESWDRPGPSRWLSAPFWLSWTAASAVFTNQLPPPDLEDLVSEIAPRPLFLIYSGKPVGGEELNAELSEAAGAPTSVWRIADAGHTGGLSQHREEYERRVVGYFDAELLRDRAAGRG